LPFERGWGLPKVSVGLGDRSVGFGVGDKAAGVSVGTGIVPINSKEGEIDEQAN